MERRNNTILKMLIKAQVKRHNEINYIFNEDQIITLIIKCEKIDISQIKEIISKL